MPIKSATIMGLEGCLIYLAYRKHHESYKPISCFLKDHKIFNLRKQMMFQSIFEDVYRHLTSDVLGISDVYQLVRVKTDVFRILNTVLL